MIWLIEGPDGSGKSTLIRQLKDVGFIEYNEVPRNWPMQYENYDSFFKTINPTFDVIIDRGFISEIVYRIVKQDRKPNINLFEISSLLKDYKIGIVYCKNENAFENAMIRGETYITKRREHEKLTAIYDVVIQILKMFNDVPVVEYNWQTDNLNDLAKELR